MSIGFSSSLLIMSISALKARNQNVIVHFFVLQKWPPPAQYPSQLQSLDALHTSRAAAEDG